MSATERLSYSEEEVRSFLPTGWSVARPATGHDGTAGEWDPKKRAWRIRVIDNVDFDYPVVVKADDLGSGGRIEALRLAMDRVYRERLG
jgi:hypothetical protein